MMGTITKCIALATACILVGLSPAALAQEPTGRTSELPTTTVRFADLNLASEAGVRTLSHRINSAVRRVCWETNRISEREAVMDCQEQARQNAWQQFAERQERARARGVETASITARPEPR